MKSAQLPIMSINTAVASRTQLFIYFIMVAALLRLLSLGMYPLMDTTEARYAEIARIMVELDDWVTPWFDYGVPFWGKPPLSFWFTAVSFKVFGINEFAARLPHWLLGVGVAWLVWGFAVCRSRQIAIYTIALLVGSLLFFASAGAVMTDMALVLGTTMAMRGFWLGLHGTARERARERWLFFIGLGIGLLAKGPIALILSLVPIAIWAAASGRISAVWREMPWLRGGLLTLAIALPWYILAEMRTPGFLNYFLIGEHWHRFLVPGWHGDLYGSAHNYQRGTIWLFLLVDLMPWTLLLPVFYLASRKSQTVKGILAEERGWRVYLLLWGLMPAVFFTWAGNILWPYVLPGFPALALLAGGWLAKHPNRTLVERFLVVGVTCTLLAQFLFIFSLPISGRNENKSEKYLVADYEAKRKPGEALIYFGKKPFSAAFYSHGKAEYAADATHLTQRLEYASAYVAVPSRQADRLPPSLATRLKPVGTHGRYTLYVVESPNLPTAHDYSVKRLRSDGVAIPHADRQSRAVQATAGGISLDGYQSAVPDLAGLAPGRVGR